MMMRASSPSVLSSISVTLGPAGGTVVDPTGGIVVVAPEKRVGAPIGAAAKGAAVGEAVVGAVGAVGAEEAVGADEAIGAGVGA